MHNPNILVSSDYGPMIVNRYDQFIGASISQFGYWSNDDIGLIKSLIEFRLKNTEKVLFYDVGANIGTHSLAFAINWSTSEIGTCFFNLMVNP